MAENAGAVADCLIKLLSGPPEPAGTPRTGAEALAFTAYRAALRGNEKYFKLIGDMTEGARNTEPAVTFIFGAAEEYAK